MIDINLIRKTPDVVRENIRKKFQDSKLPLVDEVIELDRKNREAMQQADSLRNQRKVLSKEIGGLMKQGKKDEAEAAKAKVNEMAEELARLEQLEDYSHEGIEDVCKAYIAEKEIKNGVCLWPLRTAVSGKQMTPGGAYEIIEIIGKDETIARVKKGIELLEAAV